MALPPSDRNPGGRTRAGAVFEGTNGATQGAAGQQAGSAHESVGNDKGTPKASLVVIGSNSRPGKRGLDLGYVEPMLRGGIKRVVLRLDTDELRFQVAYTLLKPSHLGDQSVIGAADVTEKRLRHERVLHAE